MISRRSYLAIAAVMLVVLFMFQFTNVALELWNDYEENEHALDVSSLMDRDDAFTPGDASPLGAARPGVAFIGSSGSAMEQVTAAWAAYTKRDYTASTSLAAFAPGSQVPELIVLDGAGMDWRGGKACRTLLECAGRGANLVFASLPEAAVIEGSQDLKELLGIYEVRSRRTRVQGIHLYEGFLLGGEAIYKAEKKQDEERQDLELEMPWYILDSGTKVYMNGIPAGEEKVEDYPAVIWRRSLGGAWVFAVNGDYMEDAAGLGLLSAMVSETADCTVYPVVNAQNLVAANYPCLASENGPVLTRYYSLSMRGLYRDVLWPELTAVYHRGGLGLSCMMSMQFDYSDSHEPDQMQFVYYMKLLNELSAEPGLSLYSVSDTPVTKQLTEDFGFTRQAQMEYQFTSLYGGGLEEQELNNALGWDDLAGVRTVVFPYDGGSDLVGYQTDDVTRQMAVTSGYDHTYRSDLRMRGVQTALAYTSVLVDAARAVYPESKNDTWDVLSQRLTSDVPSGWENFEAFDPTTVSQCDGRIRDFLALDYTYSRDGLVVTVQHTGSGTSWFLLRARGEEVALVEGGSARLVEEGVYLIQADENEVKAVLRPVLPG